MIGPPVVMADAGLGMSQKLKKKIAVLQELDDNAVPTKPQKETTYAKKIRNIVAAEAVLLEQNRRLTGESLFSVENVAYSWKEEQSVAQHKKKRGPPNPVPSSSSSSSSKGIADASAPQSRRPSLESNASSSGKHNRTSFDSQTSDKGGVDSSSNIPTTFHRKASYPHEEALKIEKSHEEALKKSVEQVMAQLAQPSLPISDALIRTINDGLPTTTQPPNSNQVSQKPPSTRKRREAYDPAAALSSLQSTAAATTGTTGTVSILDRVRTLQHSQKLRKSFECIPTAPAASPAAPLDVPVYIPFLSEGDNEQDKVPENNDDKQNSTTEGNPAVSSSTNPDATAVVPEQQSCGEVKWENTPWGPMLVSISEKVPEKPIDKQTEKRKKTRSMDFTPLSELFPKKPPVVAPAVAATTTTVSSTSTAAGGGIAAGHALLNGVTDKQSVVSSSSRGVGVGIGARSQSEKILQHGRAPTQRISRASFQLDYNMRDLTGEQIQ